VELPAVLLAAHNQQMISLAMRRADGLILNMVPASDLVATLRHVRNASERAGRANRPAQVGMFQLAAFGPHDAALAAARLVLAGFCRAPAVRKRLHSFHSRHADTADRVAELPPTADAAALVELMPADMVEDFAVTSEAALAERTGLAGDLGVDFVALSVFPVPLRLRKSFPPVPEEEAAEQATVEAITIIDQLTRSSGVIETTAMAAEASV
jgi:alkanesulfonate monooxygenase SsuD/methylene tetrahydromethanopterin reductase-like flavin-dependent oxidoreductase (luciferase family)